jgi:hypothetical protein
MTACNYLLPTHDHNLTPEPDCFECVLARGHDGDHLCQITGGQFVGWCPLTIPCGSCGEYCECFEYQFMSEDEAQNLLTQRSG